MTSEKGTNKHGVPHHLYQLHLSVGVWQWIDIADPADFSKIVKTDDCRVRFGNDYGGSAVIDDVIDLETEKHLDVAEWAKSVWAYADRYAA